MSTNTPSPRIFLSYSWSSPEHQAWVIGLAERLQQNGVIVILDVWDLKPGHDKHKFMEQMVTDPQVTRVLLICDPQYATKANSREGGVGTESQIVSSEIYAQTEQRKFIPVIAVRHPDGSDPLPAYLASRMYIDLSRTELFAEEFERLLRDIFDKPSRSRPALGPQPHFLSDNSPVSSGTSILRDFIKHSTIALPEQSRNLLNSVVKDLESLRVVTRPEGFIDDLIVSHVQSTKHLRDAAIEAIKSLIECAPDNDANDIITDFFERLLSLMDWPPNVNTWNPRLGDHYRFFGREVFLYTLSLLLSHKKWNLASLCLSTNYCITIKRERTIADYTMLDEYIYSIDMDRNGRLPQRLISLVAEMVKERADNPYVSFEEIMQADFLLALRHVISTTTQQSLPRWNPRTSVYAIRKQNPFPLCFRWRANRDLQAIPVLFQVADRKALYARLSAISPDGKVQGFAFDYRPVPFMAWASLNDLANKPDWPV